MRPLVLLVALAGSAFAKPCPRDERLLDIARAAFPAALRTAAGTEIPIRASSLTCRPLRGEPAAWLLVFESPGAGAGLLVAVADEAGAEWQLGTFAGTTPMSILSARAVDLAGDGHDEIVLVIDSWDHDAVPWRTLVVHPLDEHGLGAELPLGDPRGSDRCVATWRLVAGPKRSQQIELEPPACARRRERVAPATRRRFAWVSGKLVSLD